jgi:hypothetical protein
LLRASRASKRVAHNLKHIGKFKAAFLRVALNIGEKAERPFVEEASSV